MNHCPCNDKILAPGHPRLFNRITITLVLLWVLIVTVVTESHVADSSRLPDSRAFIEQFLL